MAIGLTCLDNCEPPRTPEGGLAAAIIHRAFHDADGRLFLHRPRGWKKARETDGRLYVDTIVLHALQFLTTPNPDLDFWCAVCGWESDPMRDRAKRFYRRKLQQFTAHQHHPKLCYVRSAV